ncbi:MAG: nitroreductase family protein [Acidimicrobiales bacterium]
MDTPQVDLAEVLARRRMVRSFDGRPVPPAKLEWILGVMLRAPSAGNTQATEFLVLDKPAQTKAYWDVCLGAPRPQDFPWPGLLRAPALIVALTCRQAYLDRYGEPDKASLRGGPQAWTVPYWYVDGGFNALVGLLAAVDVGMGGALFCTENVPGLRDRFMIPDRFEPVGTLAIGYPDDHDRPSSSVLRPSRPAGDRLHRGRW